MIVTVLSCNALIGPVAPNLFQVAEPLKHYWAFGGTYTLNNTNLRILKERSKEWAKLLGSAEPRLKNIELDIQFTFELLF